jgi:hypothetical protein
VQVKVQVQVQPGLHSWEGKMTGAKGDADPICLRFVLFSLWCFVPPLICLCKVSVANYRFTTGQK